MPLTEKSRPPKELRAAWQEYARRHNHDPDARIHYVTHKRLDRWCAYMVNAKGDPGSMPIADPGKNPTQDAINWLNAH